MLKTYLCLQTKRECCIINKRYEEFSHIKTELITKGKWGAKDEG